MSVTLAAAAFVLGPTWWHLSRLQARTVGSPSGSVGVWVGVLVAAAAAALVAIVPLRLPDAFALPIVIGLGIAVTTDLMERRVYDVVSLGLIAFALGIAAYRAELPSAVAGLALYGGLSLTVVLLSSADVLGLADVYGFALFGALFGVGAWVEVVLGLFVAAIVGAGIVVARRRHVTELALFPGLAVAAVLGLSPVVPSFEAFCASLV